MTPPAGRRVCRDTRELTQPVRLTMQDMAVLRDALLPARDALREAVKPFGLVTTWDATTRLDDVIGKIIAARCALKRRGHPGYNPAGDSECDAFATDDELDRWAESHPEPPALDAG